MSLIYSLSVNCAACAYIRKTPFSLAEGGSMKPLSTHRSHIYKRKLATQICFLPFY